MLGSIIHVLLANSTRKHQSLGDHGLHNQYAPIVHFHFGLKVELSSAFMDLDNTVSVVPCLVRSISFHDSHVKIFHTMIVNHSLCLAIGQRIYLNQYDVKNTTSPYLMKQMPCIKRVKKNFIIEITVLILCVAHRG